MLSCKAIAFLWEIWFSCNNTQKASCFLTKALRSPEKHCTFFYKSIAFSLKNVTQNHCILPRNAAVSLKTYFFSQNNYVLPRNYAFSFAKSSRLPKKLCILLQKCCFPEKKNSHKSIAISKETLHFLAKILFSKESLRSLAKALHSPEKLCVLSQKYSVFTKIFAFSHENITFSHETLRSLTIALHLPKNFFFHKNIAISQETLASVA